MGEYIRFLFGGAVNTFIAALSYYVVSLFFSEFLALAFSFWLTFFVSYIVNSKFVFRNNGPKKLFLMAVIFAFIMQQLVGTITLELGGKGMFVFLIVSLVHVPFFFCLCRFWVFR